MKLLYGTQNTAKLETMKNILLPLNIELIGLNELNGDIPYIDETGSNPLENAIIKATTLYSHFHIPVFSCDSGLFFDNVDEELQPGTHVRRVNQKELTDEEMITYYSSLAHQYGGELTARYKNAICFIADKNHIFKSMANNLSGPKFLLVETAHPKRIPGFPLDSLSKNISSKEYFFDSKNDEFESAIEEGFQFFFKYCFDNIKKATD